MNLEHTFVQHCLEHIFIFYLFVFLFFFLATEGEEASNEGEEEVVTKETINAPENKFQFKNDIAALHMAMVKKAKERANLLHDVGSHRRALCSRRDLEIRRQLCQVDKVWICLLLLSIYLSFIISSSCTSTFITRY